RYLHNTDLSLLGQIHLGPPNMYIGIFPTRTKPEINAELEHLESIVQQFFTEKSGRFTVFPGFGREVKKYEYPHATVLVESGKTVGFHYLNNARFPQNIGYEWVIYLIYPSITFPSTSRTSDLY